MSAFWRVVLVTFLWVCVTQSDIWLLKKTPLGWRIADVVMVAAIATVLVGGK